MEAIIGNDVPLDYVTFQILPGNRYDACICSEEKEEIIGHGPLDQLLEHLPNMKDEVTKESCDCFKLKLPDDVDQNEWFTKATMTRFLQIICSPDSLNKSVAISKEMFQLEEARKFHLSLYAKAEDGSISTDASKNELLRAMDSRLAALTEELVSTFSVAAGVVFSSQDLLDLHTFFEHFGDEETRNLLSKLSETNLEDQNVVPLDNKNSIGPTMSIKDYVNKTGGVIQISGSLNFVKPVLFNASPAKAAEIERQSTTESDDSSFSSEDDQPSVERSRPVIRSASPRRSASPMRRVQIGRSGPRRTPALTIKSLTCFPARERISSQRDTGSEEPEKKTEVNVTRISVQDAISLFESKQRDIASDTQKKSNVDSSANASRAVLRRWSSGMSESQKSLTQTVADNKASEDNSNVVDKEALKSEDVEPNMNLFSGNEETKVTVKVDMESESSNKTESHLDEDDVLVSEAEKITGKLDSVEWTRKKEEELSQMLMKFAEYKNAEPDNGKKRTTSLKQRRAINGPPREKKEEKLRGESGGKKVQSEFRAKQKVLNEPKAEKSSMKVGDVGKKLSTTTISVNANKNSPVSSSSKKESLKPAVPKKVPSKSSSLPATRKSWPSTPSPRATGALSTKIPSLTPSGTATSRQKPQSSAPSQKPQSPASLSRPSPKLERPQIQKKDIKKTPVEAKKSLKRVDDSKNLVLPKTRRTTKTKAAVGSEEDAGTSPAKVVVRKKGTKKSSVVPLEAKPSTTRRTTNLAKTPTVQKIEIPTQTQAEETSTKSKDPICIHENIAAKHDVAYQMEENPLSETYIGHPQEEREPEIEKPKGESEEETVNEIRTEGDEIAERMSESPTEAQPIQESVISPAAWEESSSQDIPIPSVNSATESPVNHEVVASSEPRVRHSLSQMLLEESSEPDIIEWGNAENPPTMVYQKDAPKGLKRLLKFARKNKGEINGTAWSSPYTSDGEDDGDETKSLGKRHSDNLLRKVALHSKNYGEGFLSDSEPLSARSNASNSSARSSSKFNEGHGTSKGTRFFSLSAFRSNKN